MDGLLSLTNCDSISIDDDIFESVLENNNNNNDDEKRRRRQKERKSVQNSGDHRRRIQ